MTGHGAGRRHRRRVRARPTGRRRRARRPRPRSRRPGRDHRRRGRPRTSPSRSARCAPESSRCSLNPNLLADEQRALLADADPALMLRDDDLPTLLDGRPRRARAVAARPTDALHERDDRHAEGRVERAARRAATRRRSSPRSGRCGASPPTTCTSSRRRSTTRRRCGSRPARCSRAGSVVLTGAFDADARRRRHRRPPADDHVRRARPPPAALRPARAAAARLVPPRRARRRAVSRPAQAPGARRVPGAGRCGSSTARPRVSSRSAHPTSGRARPGTVGRARPGRQLRRDRDGAIWCAVPRYARFEYWRDPDKTAAAWRDDAFTVGDLGRLDDDGYLFLDGRRDDLVITGGMNVYPLEVERVLLAHPGRRGGRRLRRRRRAVGAASVRRGRRRSRVRRRRTCGSRTGSRPYKRPKQVLMVDAIPVSATGKVKRAHLAAALGLER